MIQTTLNRFFITRRTSLGNKIKKTKTWLILALLVLGQFLLPMPALAQTKWEGACIGSPGTLSADVVTIQGFSCLVANVLNVALTLFTFVGFCMFIYASITWLISGGQASNLEKAKNTFLYAVLGIVLALTSFVIIQIIAYFTGIQSFMTIKFLGGTVPASIQQKGAGGN